MTGKPDYIPADWTNWAEVQPYSSARGGYAVTRKDDGFLFGTFVCESHADEFAKLKNDQLLAGQGI